jgi:hypothetical protein
MSSALTHRRANVAEVGGVALVIVVLWWLLMGWDWSVVPSGTDPNAYQAPQSNLDWMLLYLVAILAAGWLAVRGRAVLGGFAAAVPVVVLSGWRMAAATVIGANLWPVGLATLAATLGAACAGAARVGARLRRRSAR